MRKTLIVLFLFLIWRTLRQIAARLECMTEQNAAHHLDILALWPEPPYPSPNPERATPEPPQKPQKPA